MSTHGCTSVPCTICGCGASLNQVDQRTPSSYFDMSPAVGVSHVASCVLGVEGLQPGDLVEVVNTYTSPMSVPAIYLYSMRAPVEVRVFHRFLVGFEKLKFSDMDSYISRVIHRFIDAT